MTELFEEITDASLLVRRVTVVANYVISEKAAKKAEKTTYRQMTIFDAEKDAEDKKEKEQLEKEHSLQEAMLAIKQRYGKNAILRGTNFEEGAMTIERNGQVGGHKG